MSMDDEPIGFGMGAGCDLHGEEHSRECNMCGAEFCRLCYPRTAVCPACAEQAETDEEAEEGSDFDDVENLGEVLDEDKEAERLVSEGEDEPPPKELEEES